MRRWAFAIALWGACSFEPGSEPGQEPNGSGSGSSGSGSDSGTSSGVTVACPGTMCGAVCCDGTCTSSALGTCEGHAFHCDGPEDCAPSEVCCNNKNGSVCTAGSCSGHEACHTAADCGGSCNNCSYEGDYGQQICCE